MTTHADAADAIQEHVDVAPSAHAELERQLVLSAMHSHSVDSQLAERINALEAGFYGLVEQLVERRVLGESELAASAQRVGQAIEQRGERLTGGVALRVDPPDPRSFIPVDCSDRMPVCKAVCCRLSFPLAATEVEAGRLKWDLARPYFIRHDVRGVCVHQEHETGACGVYADRPRPCRSYTCATDSRIWSDFNNKVLNQRWIDEHLGPERVQLVQIRMDVK